MKIEIYKDFIGEWRWRLKASNGKIIAHGESYKKKLTMLSVIKELTYKGFYPKIVEVKK